MTLEKAIEIKEIEHKEPGTVSYNDYEVADQLSIEALKAIQLKREFDPSAAIGWLPGETKE